MISKMLFAVLLVVAISQAARRSRRRRLAAPLRDPGRRSNPAKLRARRRDEAPSFTCLRNRDHAFIAIDHHCGGQSSGAVAKVLKKSPCVRPLHESRLEQLRIIGLSRPPFGLTFTDNGQNLDLFHGLRPERKPSQVAVPIFGLLTGPSKQCSVPG